MKRVKPYLPFEFDFIGNDAHSELIERYGAQGLGVYFMLLMELRNHDGYRCRLSTLKCAARRCAVDAETLVNILCDFGLFEFHECENRILVSSPYVDRVMQPCGEKTGEYPATASENTVTVEVPVYGVSTVAHRIIKNKLEIKIKTSTTEYIAATAADKNSAAVADDVFEFDEPVATLSATGADVVCDVVELSRVSPQSGTSSTGRRVSAPSVQRHRQGRKYLSVYCAIVRVATAEWSSLGCALQRRPPPRMRCHAEKTWFWRGATRGAIRRNRHFALETVALGANKTGIWRG